MPQPSLRDHHERLITLGVIARQRVKRGPGIRLGLGKIVPEERQPRSDQQAGRRRNPPEMVERFVDLAQAQTRIRPAGAGQSECVVSGRKPQKIAGNDAHLQRIAAIPGLQIGFVLAFKA